MSDTTWYICPKPGHTAQVLGRETEVEDVCRNVRCADGRKRDLYRCKWKFVSTALSSAHEHELEFSVWKQWGRRPPALFDPKKVFSGKVPEEIKQTREQLARIVAKAAQK